MSLMRLKYLIPDKEKIALSYRPIDNGNSINERERVYFKQAEEKNRAQRHLREFDFNRTTTKTITRKTLTWF